MSILNKPMAERLGNLEECAKKAPEGTYQEAKNAAQAINECGAAIMRIIQENGFNCRGTDTLRNIEVSIYGLILQSNPTAYGLITGEGFGAAMSMPCKDRVIEQAIRDRDFMKKIMGKRTESQQGT